MKVLAMFLGILDKLRIGTRIFRVTSTKPLLSESLGAS